jgi:Uncharacterized protein conserved in bacteria
MKNPEVDKYFEYGCGRCPQGGTPDCKVHKWPEVLEMLRILALGCGLNEELKWGVPVYTFRNKNIVLIGAFKEYCVLNFFKGALLSDEHKILTKPGENTQASRVIRFTKIEDITEREQILKSYIFEAVEVEKAGLKVELKKSDEYLVPEEFQKKLDGFPELKAAFEALTPGRQRAYLLYFTQPKQSKTRESRIEKYIQQILIGKGFND